MSSRRRQPDPIPDPDHAWDPFDAGTWPGDADNPEYERLAQEQDKSSVTGEKFARYAALAVLVPLVLLVVAITLLAGSYVLLGLWELLFG